MIPVVWVNAMASGVIHAYWGHPLALKDLPQFQHSSTQPPKTTHTPGTSRRSRTPIVASRPPHAPLLLPWGALRVDWWFDQDRSRSVSKLMWTCKFASAKCVKEDVFDFKKCLGWMALWGLQAKLKCSVDWEPEGLESNFETQSKSWRATCNLLTLDSTQKTVNTQCQGWHSPRHHCCSGKLFLLLLFSEKKVAFPS